MNTNSKLRDFIALLLCWTFLFLPSLANAQSIGSSTRAVYKSNVAAYQNYLLEDLKVGPSRTMTIVSGGTFVAGAGATVNLTGATVIGLTGGGSITSVNGNSTAAIVLTTSDIADSANKRYVTDAKLAILSNTTAPYTTTEASKLAGVAAGATVGATWDGNISGQPTMVSQAEAEAGTATTQRIWSAERVKQAVVSLTASLGGGNMTANGTLTGNSTEGNIIVGNGGTDARVADNLKWNHTGNGTLTVGPNGNGTLVVRTVNVDIITANSLQIGNVIGGNVGGTGVNNGNRTMTYGGSVTFNGSFTTQFNVSANTVLDLPASGLLTTLPTVKAAMPVTIPLTIDLVADGGNWGKTFIPANFTVSKIIGVHVANGGALSSPSIVATIKHGTDRTTGTTVEAVTITSSTGGTVVTSGIDDAAIPANSFVWLETSVKSGTTGNLEVYLVGTYD